MGKALDNLMRLMPHVPEVVCREVLGRMVPDMAYLFLLDAYPTPSDLKNEKRENFRPERNVRNRPKFKKRDEYVENQDDEEIGFSSTKIGMILEKYQEMEIEVARLLLDEYNGDVEQAMNAAEELYRDKRKNIRKHDKEPLPMNIPDKDLPINNSESSDSDTNSNIIPSDSDLQHENQQISDDDSSFDPFSLPTLDQFSSDSDIEVGPSLEQTISEAELPPLYVRQKTLPHYKAKHKIPITLPVIPRITPRHSRATPEIAQQLESIKKTENLSTDQTTHKRDYEKPLPNTNSEDTNDVDQQNPGDKRVFPYGNAGIVNMSYPFVPISIEENKPKHQSKFLHRLYPAFTTRQIHNAWEKNGHKLCRAGEALMHKVVDCPNFIDLLIAIFPDLEEISAQKLLRKHGTIEKVFTEENGRKITLEGKLVLTVRNTSTPQKAWYYPQKQILNIDLHGFTSIQIQNYLPPLFRALKKSHFARRVNFITGCGFKSKNRIPILRPLCKKLCGDYKLKSNINENNEGMIVVYFPTAEDKERKAMRKLKAMKTKN